MKKIITLLSLFLVISTYSFAQQTYDFTVAKDGSGTFKTIQEAINAVPDLRANRTRILIKPGVYKEKLTLAPTKTNVSFIGEDALKTILTYDDYAPKKNRFGENIGTSGSSSFFIYGDGFTAENITFENSAGPVGQAVAVRIDGDKVSFWNCRFLGFQDTLYPHGENSRQYYKNCYIEGTVDFIFGFSTALFDDCTIYCKNTGYATAASTPQGKAYGFVFRGCTITGSAAEGAFYLGRPWRPYAKVAFLNCELGKVINPKGWDNWSNPQNEQTATFSEHNNTGAGAALGQRVAWSKVLTAKDTELYTIEKVLGGWIPDNK